MTSIFHKCRLNASGGADALRALRQNDAREGWLSVQECPNVSAKTRPDLALTFYVGTIFRRPLIESFEQVINFHDSLLPEHRGIGATSFLIYQGDKRTGFTFHRMTEAIDAGPILLQDSFALDDRIGLDEVIRRKIAAAVEKIPQVFELVLARDPGRPQEGPASYHSVRDVRAARFVAYPQAESAAKLHRVVRAFGTAFLKIGGVFYPVARLRNASPGQGLAFRTADGRMLAPDRFRYRRGRCTSSAGMPGSSRPDHGVRRRAFQASAPVRGRAGRAKEGCGTLRIARRPITPGQQALATLATRCNRCGRRMIEGERSSSPIGVDLPRHPWRPVFPKARSRVGATG